MNEAREKSGIVMNDCGVIWMRRWLGYSVTEKEDRQRQVELCFLDQIKGIEITVYRRRRRGVIQSDPYFLSYRFIWMMLPWGEVPDIW